MKTVRQKQAEAIANGSYRLRRRIDPEMPTRDELAVALWEMTVEGKTPVEAGVPALQERREAVKARHPKPARA